MDIINTKTREVIFSNEDWETCRGAFYDKLLDHQLPEYELVQTKVESEKAFSLDEIKKSIRAVLIENDDLLDDKDINSEQHAVVISAINNFEGVLGLKEFTDWPKDK